MEISRRGVMPNGAGRLQSGETCSLRAELGAHLDSLHARVDHAHLNRPATAKPSIRRSRVFALIQASSERTAVSARDQLLAGSRSYVVLLDGGFVTKRLRHRLGRFPSAEDVMGVCERIDAHPALLGRERLRIHFYDAPPADGRLTVASAAAFQSGCARRPATM